MCEQVQCAISMSCDSITVGLLLPEEINFNLPLCAWIHKTPLKWELPLPALHNNNEMKYVTSFIMNTAESNILQSLK